MNIRIITIALLLATLPVSAQKKKTVVNDSNTPLHLLQPAYQGTYGDLTPGQIKKDIDRVFAYIDKETPARVVDKNTGKLITDYTTMGEEAQLERGAFRLASYEWGVTYSALIAAAEATGDQRYMDYVQNRFRFLRKWRLILNVCTKRKVQQTLNCCKSSLLMPWMMPGLCVQRW